MKKKLKIESNDIEREFDVADGTDLAEDPDIAEEIVHGSRYNFPEIVSVSSGPHITAKNSTSSIMLDVIIALTPAYVWGVLVFGMRSLILGIISVAS